MEPGSRWDRSRFSELLSPSTPAPEQSRPEPSRLEPLRPEPPRPQTTPAPPAQPAPATAREPGLGTGDRRDPGLGTGSGLPGLGTAGSGLSSLGVGERRESGLGGREPALGSRESGLGSREPGLGTGGTAERREPGLGTGSTGERREPGLGSREPGLGTGGTAERREPGLGTGSTGERREPGIGSGNLTPGRPTSLRAYDVPTPNSAPPYPYEGDLDDVAQERVVPPPIAQQRAAFPLVRPSTPGGGRRADWGTAEHKTTDPARHALIGGTPVQGVPRVASDEPGPTRPAYDPSSFPRRLSYEPPAPYEPVAPPPPYDPQSSAYESQPASYSGFGETTARIPGASESAGLPQRVPAQPDVPKGVPEPPLVEATAETPALARIATHLRRGDTLPAQERQEGFDVQAILAAVRGVDGVRDASLRSTPTGAHSLRLDLSEGADPAEVSRRVARLLQDRMGLDAAMPGEVPPPASAPPAAAPVSPSALVPRVRPASAPPASTTSLASSTPLADSIAPEREAREREARERETRDRETRERETRERETRDRETRERETRERETRERETREREAREREAREQGIRDRENHEREIREREARDRHAAAARLVPDLEESAEVVPTGVSAPPRPLYPTEHPGPRVVIENVYVNTFGSDATVEVRLGVDGRTASGTASGPAVDGYLLRLCAMATAGAVDELLAESDNHPDGAARCFVEHAAAVPFGAAQVAVVVLLLSCGGWVEQLAGSAVVTSDDRHAMVRATLAAVNRRLEALLNR
ncbi:hypothetical protein [Paractinoplanes ovalisporus]|uniref:hypothetical protein n=1 Tax=Paractinoplanes ovalisporus TaxID=2810368 RepID=UPI0027DE388C|nr:hypothetical protein [Actinoplanes ovalisporus]